jgi:hypothetical protein
LDLGNGAEIRLVGEVEAEDGETFGEEAGEEMALEGVLYTGT